MMKFKIQNSKFKINQKSKCQIAKQKFYYFKFMLSAYFIVSFLALGTIILGCATIKEAAKSIAGISTKALEEARKNAISRQFNYDYNTCYNKAEAILKEKGSCIYAKDPKKQMLAIYVSKDDTTTVGVFFKEIDANNTQVEVSSLSTYAKELIAKELFSGLEKGQPDAKKEM